MSVRNWLLPMRDVCTLALGADGHPRELDHGVGRQHADDRGGAADRQALDGLAHQRRRCRRPRRRDRRRAAGELADRLHRVVLDAVDDVSGADAPRHLELAVEHVDGDDPVAPPMRAPWMMDSPTPPQPNTATVCPACSPTSGSPRRRR